MCSQPNPLTIDQFLTRHGTEALTQPISTDRLFLRQYGRGQAILLAVHGFGRSGRRLERLALALGERFTTFAPDLPYHGRSEWVENDYTPADLAACYNALLRQYPGRPVYLLGHSLGGRILSNTLPLLERKDIRDLALIAPDGAGGRYTNWLDTLPNRLIRPLARFTERPRYLLRLSQWLRKRGVINRYSAEYLNYNLRDGTFRRRLAGSLRSVLRFPPDPDALEAALAERGITATVFVGDRDPLLHHERLDKVYGPLPSVDVVDYPGSHWLPERLLFEYYQAALKD